MMGNTPGMLVSFSYFFFVCKKNKTALCTVMMVLVRIAGCSPLLLDLDQVLTADDDVTFFFLPGPLSGCFAQTFKGFSCLLLKIKINDND